MGTFSIWHWMIVLVIVVLVFGTKKLRNLGSDLGGALKGFKDGMKEGDTGNSNTNQSTQQTHDNVIDVQAKREHTSHDFQDNASKDSSVKTTQHTTEK